MISLNFVIPKALCWYHGVNVHMSRQVMRGFATARFGIWLANFSFVFLSKSIHVMTGCHWVLWARRRPCIVRSEVFRGYSDCQSSDFCSQTHSNPTMYGKWYLNPYTWIITLVLNEKSCCWIVYVKDKCFIQICDVLRIPLSNPPWCRDVTCIQIGTL